ncbi:hypothetical protein FN846DRAFT_971711 [Sphaerosporella brunnea]|uniref:Secreted protein n=1 Tax=Sphaerosporella brunnea TaxID=1250544 RepID=A0A5J5EJS9_9PEZI|nr:hypothetical protein FN846DRAFT_971711 [Sphaerosporella brunnea]
MTMLGWWVGLGGVFCGESQRTDFNVSRCTTGSSSTSTARLFRLNMWVKDRPGVLHPPPLRRPTKSRCGYGV